MRTLLQSFRERKLVQWTVAYLAAAFVGLQVYDLLVAPFPTLAPFQRPFTVLLGVGIPITAVLAWYHGEKGEQSFTGREILVVTALLVMGGVAARWLGPAPPAGGIPEFVPGPEAGPPAWLLPADFSGTASLEFRRIGKALVLTELASSPTLRIIQNEDIRQGLILSERPDTTFVSVELALELAERAGIRPVLEGTLDQIGTTFSVRLRLLDRESSAQQVAAATEQASGEDELIPALGRAARELRRQLGETADELRSQPVLVEVMTPSLEALRWYRAPWRTNEERIENFRAAIQVDTGFAAAMLAVPSSFANLGDYDSAMVYLEEAVKRSSRLTPAHQLLARVGRASISGDIPEAYRLQLQLVEQYGIGYNNVGVFLDRLGRHADAVKFFNSTKPPFGNNLFLFRSQGHRLLVLGQLREAAEFIAANPTRARESVVELAAAQRNWSEVLDLTQEWASDPPVRPSNGADVLALRAGALGALGRIGDARALLGELVESPDITAGQRRWFEGSRLALAFASGRGLPPPAQLTLDDASTAGLVFAAGLHALHGDTVAARRARDAVLAKDTDAYAPYSPALALAEVAPLIRAGDWADALPVLAPAASGYWPYYPRGNLHNATLLRWLAAETFEHSQQPDSASHYFELLTGPLFDERGRYGLVSSFVDRRLAKLAEAAGDRRRARIHWERFLVAVQEPDDEMRPLVLEAQAALRALR